MIRKKKADTVNTTEKKVIHEAEPRVTHFIDKIGNQEESVVFETLIIQNGTERTWLRKHKNNIKGCLGTIPFKKEDAENLWKVWIK